MQWATLSTMNITPSLLYRLSGIAVVVAFVFNLIGGTLHPVVGGWAHSVEALSEPFNPYAQYLLLIGTLLQFLGLPAVYVWVSRKTGLLGLIGFALYFFGGMLVILPHLTVEAFVSVPIAAKHETAHFLIPTDDSLFADPAFQNLQLFAGLVFMVSMLIIGIALLKSRAVPLWIGAVMTLGGLILLTPIPQAPVLSGLVIEIPRGLAIAAIGVLMIKGNSSGADTRSLQASSRVDIATR
ncbi:hypothetical protein CH292_12305 [Rhodococcus sp. 14-2470-1a]|nr:hypothetical protein CH292_12305 [Rhodococcus sp. 14-2470-1a]